MKEAGAADDYSVAPLLFDQVDDGIAELPTALLPPGQWQVKLRSVDANCATVDESAWSSAFTIVAAPRLSVVSPSLATAPDFASEVVGDAWDMGSPGDLIPSPYLQPSDIAEAAFANGILSLRAIIPANRAGPAAESDANIFPNLLNRQIDSVIWRYLTVRLKTNVPQAQDINWGVWPTAWADV